MTLSQNFLLLATIRTQIGPIHASSGGINMRTDIKNNAMLKRATKI
jgi:hypothetical protein